MIDLNSTYYMAGVLKQLPTVYTFFRDRYFGEKVCFKEDKIIVDIDDGAGDIVAPYVSPMTGDIPLLRHGYQTREIIPPYIAPSINLTKKDIEKWLAGEKIITGQTPEARARALKVGDISTLNDSISRREEFASVNLMLDNGLVMKHFGDNGTKTEDIKVSYYEDGKNNGVFTADTPWAVGTKDTPGTWYNAVCDLIVDMMADGKQVTDLLVGTEVAKMILSDPWLKTTYYGALKDTRGEIDPRWQANGVSYLARINFRGIDLDVFSVYAGYDEMAYDNKKKLFAKTRRQYFPAKGALLAAPNTGRAYYGAMTQMEQDGEFHTRTGERIPNFKKDYIAEVQKTIVTSRHLPAPKTTSPWRGCRNVLGT